MNYKESNYVSHVKYEDKCLLHNGITGFLIPLNLEEYKRYRLMVDDVGMLREHYPSVFLQFIKWGFIVDESINELDIVRKLNRDAIYSDKGYWLTVIPTLGCNLHCWYCSGKESRTTMKQRMSPAMLANVQKFILNLNEKEKLTSLNLDWFGGEPLLYFNEIIYPISLYGREIMNKSGLGFSNHVTTNGTLINKDYIHRFNCIGLNSFQITLDGNKEIHDTIKNIKGEPTYDLVINNINLLCEGVKDVNVIVRINYSKDTLTYLNKFVDEISVDNRNKIVVDFQKVWQIDSSDIEKDKLWDLIKYFISNGFRVVSGLRNSNHRACYSDKFYHSVINFDGTVFKCTSRNYNPDICIGSISDAGEMILNDVHNAYYLKPSYENEKCLNCKRLPSCYGLCIQNNFEQNKLSNNKDRTENYCPYDDYVLSFEESIIIEALNRKLV